MSFETKPSQGYVKLKEKELPSIFNFCGDDVIAPALFLKEIMKWLFKENVFNRKIFP